MLNGLVDHAENGCEVGLDVVTDGKLGCGYADSRHAWSPEIGSIGMCSIAVRPPTGLLTMGSSQSTTFQGIEVHTGLKSSRCAKKTRSSVARFGGTGCKWASTQTANTGVKGLKPSIQRGDDVGHAHGLGVVKVS